MLQCTQAVHKQPLLRKHPYKKGAPLAKPSKSSIVMNKAIVCAWILRAIVDTSCATADDMAHFSYILEQVLENSASLPPLVLQIVCTACVKVCSKSGTDSLLALARKQLLSPNKQVQRAGMYLICKRISVVVRVKT